MLIREKMLALAKFKFNLVVADIFGLSMLPCDHVYGFLLDVVFVDLIINSQKRFKAMLKHA